MDWLTKVIYLQPNPIPVIIQIDYIFQKLVGCLILSKMHQIGQVLNYDKFQSRGPKDLHVLFHFKDAPKIYESPYSEVIEFIDTYITFAVSDKDSYPELYKFVTTVNNCKHMCTCCKKKGVTFRFGARWTPSETIRIVGKEEVDKSKIVSSKKILN